MSNHFTGLSLGPPLGDQRLDLCDLYAFQSPTDRSRTVLILNANPNADALHPDAIYRLAIDTDGDLINDIAFSFVFSTPVDGQQTVSQGQTTVVLEKRNNKWLIVLNHTSLAPKLPLAAPATAPSPQQPAKPSAR